MKIVSISENIELEKRVAVTPEIAKKYIGLGFEVLLPENYGQHLGIQKEEYLELGVKILKDEKEIINSGDIIAQVGLFSDDKQELLSENQILIGSLNPFSNKNKLDNLIKKKVNIFSLELFLELREHNLWIFYHLRQI